MRLSVRTHAGIPEEELASLEALVRPLRILQDVVRLGLAQRPPLLIHDVVVQDEFTHDVVFAPDGGDPAAIVLDCT